MTRIYIIIILAVLLLLSLGGLGYVYKEWRSAEKEKKSLTELNGKAFKEVESYKNKYDNLVTKNKSLQFESSTIKELVKEGQLSVLKEFSGLKKNYRNLENLIQLQAKVSSNLDIPITMDNTFDFDGEYRDIEGVIRIDSAGFRTLSIIDTTTVPINAVLYWQRKWFLGAKSYSIEATSPNKAVKLTGLESIQVRKK